jgi:hypothetical protein
MAVAVRLLSLQTLHLLKLITQLPQELVALELVVLEMSMLYSINKVKK